MPSNCPLRILVPSNINLKTPKELVNRLKKLIEQKEAKLNQIKILKSKIAEYEKKNTRMEQFRLENLGGYFFKWRTVLYFFSKPVRDNDLILFVS